MTEATEAEMVGRFVDGCRNAADCAARICRAFMQDAIPAPGDLTTMLRWMRQASGSAGQLAHAQANPAFLSIRDNLETMRGMVMRVSLADPLRSGLLLATLGNALTQAAVTVGRIATARPIARPDVLAALDARRLH